jgi:hypothetical protein
MKHLGVKNGIDRRGPTAGVQTSTEVCTAIDAGSCGGIDFCVFDMADCVLEDICIMDR